LGPVVAAEVEVQVFRGDSPAARFWRLTWLRARGRLVAAGVAGHPVDRGRNVLTDPARWFHPAMVIASGRRL